MKKLITIACCFAFVAAALTGCRRSEDNKRNETVTNPTTITTTHSTAPTSEATQPSTIPDSGYMPDNDGNGGTDHGDNSSGSTGNGNTGMGGNTNDSDPRSRTHTPSVSGNHR